MKCKSCNEEISQKFAHSLAINQCPFCGKEIMDEGLVIVLSELREIMKSAEAYKIEVFEWLKTNFNLIDSNSDEYKALIERATSTPIKIKVDPKEVKFDEKGNQLTGPALQNQDATDVFFKRAQVKPKTQDYYKNIVNQINKGSAKSNAGGFTVSSEDLANADPEEVAAYNELIVGNSNPPILSSVDPFGYDNDEEQLPAVAEMLASGKMGQANADYNARDVAKLQALQNKSSSAKKEMANSGGVGLIRRS